MKIAVLSGKGGTGKTMLAVNLATVLRWTYVDCDVEAPNGFLFLRPRVTCRQDVSLYVPEVNHELCTLCQACVQSCQFNALLATGEIINFFEKLCHSCGLCRLVCSQGAITEKARTIGYVEMGARGNLECWQGVLTPGEPMGAPIIDKLKSKLIHGCSILDAPPGSSCNVVATATDTDLALLVTEPTPFGVHDLAMVHRVTEKLNLRAAIIINRSFGEDELVEEYAEAKGLPIIGRFPFSLSAAQTMAHGELLAEQPQWRAKFEKLGSSLRELI